MCRVRVHTLRLGDHFGSAAPSAVHHRAAGSSHAARALPPGTNTTWETGEKEKNTGVSLIISMGHFNIHPTKDRKAGKEQVGGGGEVGSGG